MKVDLWDLPDKKIYVKIKEHIRLKILKSAIISSGGMAKLAKSFNLGSHDSIRGYLYGYYFIPLWIIKELLGRFPEEEQNSLKIEIENNIEKIKTPCGKSIKNPLPIKFSPVLAKIAGHLVGDGGIRVKNGVYTVRYTNNSFFLIEEFKRDVLKIFPEADFSIYRQMKGRKRPTWHISFPAIVGVILTNLFGVLEGDAKHVPSIVLNSDKDSKAQFLKALFDDEATSPSSHSIRLEMANKGIIETAKEMLKEYGIRPSKISVVKDPNSIKVKYNFFISGFYDLQTFNKVIGFDHPEKKEKLKILLKSYRHIQYKPGEIKELIIKQLKEKDKMSLYELAKDLNRKPTAKFRRKILDLEEKGVIKSRVTKNKLKIYFMAQY